MMGVLKQDENGTVTVDTCWLGSADTREGAWDIASDFACVLVVLGVEAWKIRVRSIHTNLFAIEAIREVQS